MKTVNFNESLPNASQTPEAPPPEEQISLLDLLIVLGERKAFIAGTTVAVAALALIVSIFIPKRYTAYTTVLPPQQNSSLSTALLSQMGNMGTIGALAGGGLGLKNPADLTIALLKSRSVEDAMIQRFDLTNLYKKSRLSDARKAFEEYCSIDSNLKDGLIRIAIEDRSPQHAAEMANAYVDEYRKFSAHLATTEASQRRAFFEQQLKEAKDNLGAAEEAMKASQQKGGLIQLDSQAKALIESVAALRAQIAAKEVQIRSMTLSETASNPDIQVAQAQLGAWQNQLRQLGGSQTGLDSNLIVPRGQIPAAGMDYVRKLREVKYNELIFELLAKQLEVAKLDEAREGAVIQVVDPAVAPDRKSFPKLSIILPAVTFVWILLAIFWVLLQEGIRRAKNRPEDEQKLLALRAIWGRIPGRS